MRSVGDTQVSLPAAPASNLAAMANRDGDKLPHRTLRESQSAMITKHREVVNDARSIPTCGSPPRRHKCDQQSQRNAQKTFMATRVRQDANHRLLQVQRHKTARAHCPPTRATVEERHQRHIKPRDHHPNCHEMCHPSEGSNPSLTCRIWMYVPFLQRPRDALSLQYLKTAPDVVIRCGHPPDSGEASPGTRSCEVLQGPHWAGSYSQAGRNEEGNGA